VLIVESISADKKRFPAYGNEKIISLADIAMYTDDVVIHNYKISMIPLYLIGHLRFDTFHYQFP